MKTKTLKSVMAVLVALFSLNANAYIEIDGIYYIVNETKTAEVTFGDSKYRNKVIIPASIKKDGITYSVTSIGPTAFSDCTGLTSVTIPNSVTSIGESAFSSCSGLTSVVIPNSVTSIRNGAFAGCSGLTSVTIPNSVTFVGNGAFEDTPWYNNQPDGLVYVGNIAYKYKGTMPTNTNITIKEGTTSISPSAFRECSGLTSMIIPNSVTSIGKSAFIGCSGLTSVIIPNSITSIDEYTFSYCSGLASVTIPNSVTSISHFAFYECSGLHSVTIPNSVTSIGGDAFGGSSGLTSIKVEWNRPLAISYEVFGGVNKASCTLYVPKGTATMFMSAPRWSEFVNIVEYEDGEDAHYITIRMGDGGVLKQSVELGKTYTYAVRADEGWEVNTLTFDGEDMTALLMDGQFSTPVITGNAELNVVFKQKGNDIKGRAADSQVKVYASGKSIIVKGADENAPVNVYGTNGVLIKSAVGNTTLSLEQGVYIVKVGKESFKVGL